MNPKSVSETEALRSDIEMTRRRMDDTMDALGERLHGRHIVDEVIGFFRGHSEGASETADRVRSKLSETAGTASHAVVDTVKKNPLPILMITAGAAWLAYSAMRGRKNEEAEDTEIDDEGLYDPDTHYDRPLEYPSGSMSSESEESGSKFEQMKGSMEDKASGAKEQVKEKLSKFGDTTREKLRSARDRASEIGSKVRDRASQIGEQVQQRSREVYDKTRERVTRTADEYPLEVGLGCLAVGVLIGISVPTPGPVNRVAGPAVDRLRNRTKQAGREAMEKGKRVVQAATGAAKQEAQSQGLAFGQISGQQPQQQSGAIPAGTPAGEAEASPGTMRDVNPGFGVRGEPADPSMTRPGI